MKSWKATERRMIIAAKETRLSSRDIRYKLGSKYVKDPIIHIEKNKKMYDLLSPKGTGSLFEIGPGVGYFSYICKEFGGLNFTGIDSRLTPSGQEYFGNSIYDVMLKKLDLLNDTKTQSVYPGKAINFYKNRYDYIVAIGGSFSLRWNVDDHIFFIKNCKKNMNSGGKILLQFNRDKMDKEIIDFYEKISFYFKEENFTYLINN
jgi:hypothetical protein